MTTPASLFVALGASPLSEELDGEQPTRIRAESDKSDVFKDIRLSDIENYSQVPNSLYLTNQYAFAGNAIKLFRLGVNFTD